jgi:tetratricopeptide (TPR) repeat protein
VHPEAYDARLMASDFYIQGQDYGKAYYQLSAYIEGKGGTYPAYMQAILLANAASLNEELLHMCNLSLEAYPDSMDVRFFKGIALYEMKDYQALVDNFKDLDFSGFSNDDYALQSRMLFAEALYRMDDFARSDSLFESMIEADPENYTVLNNYSYYLAERGEKLEEAEAWSRKAIENNPENATFLDTYAWVLYKLDDFEGAEHYIMKALRFGGENDPEVNEHAGDISVALGSKEIALSYYEKALVLGGDPSRLEGKIQSLKLDEGE